MARKHSEYEVIKARFLRNKKSFAERLIKNTKAVDDCIIWTGSQKKNKYCPVNFRFGDREHVQIEAHRLFAILMTGKDIPEGYHVDHLCYDERCVKHIEVVPYDVNLKRRWRRSK